MSALPRITIVTPSLDQGAFLAEAMESVLGQGYPDLEYIVMDGGSTDGSVDVIRRYARRLAWWVSEPDAGQSAALNRGFRESTGEVLGWLCADDRLCPGALRRAGEFLARHPRVDVAYGDLYHIDVSGRRTRYAPAMPFDRRLLLNSTGWIGQQSTFWRRRAFFDVGALDESLHSTMDTELWLRMALAGARFARAEGVAGEWRFHEGAKNTRDVDRFLNERGRVLRMHGLPLPGTLRARWWRARFCLAALASGRYSSALAFRLRLWLASRAGDGQA